MLSSLIAVIAPAAANAVVAFSAAVATAAAAVATVVAIAVAIAVATATTIAATAAVVDCYVFLAPPLDFDGAGRRRCRPLPKQRTPSIGTGARVSEAEVEAMTGGTHVVTYVA